MMIHQKKTSFYRLLEWSSWITVCISRLYKWNESCQLCQIARSFMWRDKQIFGSRSPPLLHIKKKILLRSSSQPVRECHVFSSCRRSFPQTEKINPMTSHWRLWHEPVILVISSVWHPREIKTLSFTLNVSNYTFRAEREENRGQAWKISLTKIINNRNGEITIPIGFTQRSRHLELGSIPPWHFLCVCTHINANLFSGVRRAFSSTLSVGRLTVLAPRQTLIE